jgi:hypothetical protein
MNNPSNPRLQGVRSTRPAQRDAGAPRTVVAVERAEYFAVAFNDEQGRLQRTVVLRVAGKVYMAPGAIEWAASLKPAAGWLEAEVNRQGGVSASDELVAAALPTSDTLDVLDQTGGAKPEESDDDKTTTP